MQGSSQFSLQEAGYGKLIARLVVVSDDFEGAYDAPCRLGAWRTCLPHFIAL